MQGATACAIVTDWPATVSVAVRASPELAATVTATVPLPVPLAVPTVAQLELLDAVHAHVL